MQGGGPPSFRHKPDSHGVAIRSMKRLSSGREDNKWWLQSLELALTAHFTEGKVIFVRNISKESLDKQGGPLFRTCHEEVSPRTKSKTEWLKCFFLSLSLNRNAVWSYERCHECQRSLTKCDQLIAGFLMICSKVYDVGQRRKTNLLVNKTWELAKLTALC